MNADQTATQTLRVLHVARFAHPHDGGTERFLAGLGRALAPLVDSRVLATDRGADGPGPAPTAPVTRVPVIGPDRLPLPIRGLRLIRAELRRADVIHVHDLRFLFEACVLAARRYGKPLVVTPHGALFHTRRLARLKRFLWRWWYGPLLRRADRVVCDSAHDAELCRAVGVERLQVVPPGADHRVVVRAPRNGGTGAQLVYFGRLAPEKSLESLATALAAAPAAWRLTVVGTGDPEYVARLKATFGGLGDRVAFLGHVTDEELAAALARCDCVVLPSTGEGFGLTLAEAMRSGAPVVAADVPAYAELSRGTDVALVDFGDSQAVVAAIRRVLDDYDPRPAVRRAESFTWHAAGERYLAAYRDVRDSTSNGALGSARRESHRHRVLGVEVDALTEAELHEAVAEALRSGRRLVLGYHNLHSAALHRQRPGMRDFYRRADHVWIDGAPIVAFGRLLGLPLAHVHRNTGVDWITRMIARATLEGRRLFLVGSKPQNLERALTALRRRYPGLHVSGRHGYFDTTPGSPENDEVLEGIRAAQPDVLLVGMGMPRQEEWISANLDALEATVIVPVGAWIDHVAGAVPVPPRWSGRAGVEWLFRLSAEPRRLAYRYAVEPWSLVPTAAVELVRTNASRQRRARAGLPSIDQTSARPPNPAARPRRYAHGWRAHVDA